MISRQFYEMINRRLKTTERGVPADYRRRK
jgi:hypothetical protein